MELDVIVAIDGPSGVGKSTVARAVAGARGMHHLDTGATYRAATVAVLESGVDPGDADGVTVRTGDLDISFHHGRVTLDGDDVTERIRDDDVTRAVSLVAAIPEVRRTLVEMQRGWVAAHDGGSVVEGRDIGTVVFPEAQVKIFLTADPDVRAARRAADAAAVETDHTVVARDLERRDRIDSTRAVSPLSVAHDAHVIDTSEMSIDEVVDAVLGFVDEALDAPQPL